MFKILFTKKAVKELQNLASSDAKTSLSRISRLAIPFPDNFDVKKMTADFYRLRSGKVRIIFEVDTEKNEIWIRKIGYRGGIYKGL